MTTPSQHLPRRGGATPLARPAAAAALGCAAVVTLGALLDGSAAAVGALVGAGLVLGVFGLGAAAVNLVSAALPSAALMVALLTYALQVLVMALAFVGLTRSGMLVEALSREWLAGGVVVGTAAWLALHVRAALTARIPAFELPASDPSRAGAR